MPPAAKTPEEKESASIRATAKKSRLAALLRHDLKILTERLAEQTDCCLVGLDEVGRGSLIGPVVGGAVCIPHKLTAGQKKLLTWLDDSKRLKPVVRAELAEAIRSFCRVGIGQAEKNEVDEMNVHYASLLSLYRAYVSLCEQAGLALHPDESVHASHYLIMDGKAVMPDLSRARQRAIIKGDGQSAAIAAASVVAKEYRDSMIKDLARYFPGYGWEVNMGYATPAHLKGIRELGLTPHHRKNFRKAHEQLLLPLG